jgi:hypothetical protein
VASTTCTAVASKSGVASDRSTDSRQRKVVKEGRMREFLKLVVRWTGFLVGLILLGPLVSLGRLAEWCGFLNVYVYVFLVTCFVLYSLVAARKIAPVISETEKTLLEASDVIKRGTDLNRKIGDYASLFEKRVATYAKEEVSDPAEKAEAFDGSQGHSGRGLAGIVRGTVRGLNATATNSKRLRSYCQKLCEENRRYLQAVQKVIRKPGNEVFLKQFSEAHPKRIDGLEQWLERMKNLEQHLDRMEKGHQIGKGLI